MTIKKPIYKHQLILLVTVLMVMTSCNQASNNFLDEPIVTVDTQVLTKRELQGAMPANLSSADSAAIAEDYIGRWIKSKLMLRKAERNLTPAEKNVEQHLQDYRASLLIHLYQQKILEQKHTPLVTDLEIETYYREMRDNFKLQENIIKGVFIKVPLDAPNQEQLGGWVRLRAANDLVNLETYSFQHASIYKVFVDNWTPFSSVNTILPEPIINEERFLRQTRFYQISDSLYNYYLSIHDVMLSGSVAPLNFVENRIKAILLNKKRGEFIKSMEQDLYDEALRDNILHFH